MDDELLGKRQDEARLPKGVSGGTDSGKNGEEDVRDLQSHGARDVPNQKARSLPLPPSLQGY